MPSSRPSALQRGDSTGYRPHRVRGAAGALVLPLIVLDASGVAPANVERIARMFHVEQEGAATYTIPIWAPRGGSGAMWGGSAGAFPD